MAARHNVRAEDLLAPGHFNAFSFGAYLGFEWTQGQRDDANFYARRFFEDLSILPTTDDVVLCERELITPGTSEQGYLCGAQMIPVTDGSRKLGFRWRCRGEEDRRHPAQYTEPTTGTIYFHTRLEFRKMLKLMYCWFTKVNVTKAAEECGVHSETACQWFYWWREALRTIAWHEYEKIGGPGDIVEVDETHIFTRKNGVGRLAATEKFWVFGGVSRTTGKRFAMRVDMRNQDILGAEILDNIAPGSFVCTDGWAAYNNIPNLPLEPYAAKYYPGHGVVNHSTNFIYPPRGEEPIWSHGFNVECEDKQYIGPHMPPDPVYGPVRPIRYHIQKCERSWEDLKTKMLSTHDTERIDGYIGDYMYRHNRLKEFGDPGQQFERVFQDMLKVYPGPNNQPIRANKARSRMYAGAVGIDECECNECD